MCHEDYNPPTYEDLITATFAQSPFRCDDCNKEINFKNPDLLYTAPGKNRVMLHGVGKFKLCGPCLAARIIKWFSTPLTQLGKSYGTARKAKGKCDSCGEIKKVAGIVWDDWASIRFGSNWWNGHWMCCDCLSECAKHGKQTSGICGTDATGRRYQRNEVGARIYE